ncbi:MAG: hypothetical protein ACTS7E_02780 [Arsenophonus sp. NC-CH8-MAG3]
MAQSKSPRKDKPDKSGRQDITSRVVLPIYLNRFMISIPELMITDRLSFL